MTFFESIAVYEHQTVKPKALDKKLNISVSVDCLIYFNIQDEIDNSVFATVWNHCLEEVETWT